MLYSCCTILQFHIFLQLSYVFDLCYEQLHLPWSSIMRFLGTKDGIFKDVQQWISSTPKAIGALQLIFIAGKLGWHHRLSNILPAWWFCLFIPILSHTHPTQIKQDDQKFTDGVGTKIQMQWQTVSSYNYMTSFSQGKIDIKNSVYIY